MISVLVYKRNPRYYDTSDDEFYDAFEAGGKTCFMN